MTWLFQGSGTQSRKHSARKMENLCKRVANNVGNERWKLCNALHLKDCIHGVRMDSLNWHLTTILLGKPDWRNKLHTKGRDNAWCRKNGADNLWQNDWNLDKPTGNNLKTNGHENFKRKKHIDEDDQKSKRASFSGFIFFTRKQDQMLSFTLKETRPGDRWRNLSTRMDKQTHKPTLEHEITPNSSDAEMQQK